MARRKLLGDDQWAALFALPAGERDVMRHCALTPDDHTLVAAKRSAPNRLGYALLLCALRYPAEHWSAGRSHHLHGHLLRAPAWYRHHRPRHRL